MSRILVLYATHDGQTRRIAERVARVLEREGHTAHVRPADPIATRGAVEAHDAVVIGGAIRYGHHPRSLEKLVRERREAIAARPNAFFSVCLSAGGPGAKPAEARKYLDDFRRATGWNPDAATSFAGALPYTRYNPAIRLLMRLIVGFAGGETDTTRDYEYTDWLAVERFAREFARRVAPRAAA